MVEPMEFKQEHLKRHIPYIIEIGGWILYVFGGLILAAIEGSFLGLTLSEWLIFWIFQFFPVIIAIIFFRIYLGRNDSRIGLIFHLVIGVSIIAAMTVTWSRYGNILQFPPTLDSLINMGALLFSRIPIVIAAVYNMFKLSDQHAYRLKTISEQVQAKDFSVKLEKNSPTLKDSTFGPIAQAFNSLIENSKNIVELIRVTSNQVTSSAEELAATSEEVNALSEEIAATIQQISKGASNQSQLATRGIEKVQSMTVSIDVSLKNIESALEIIEDIAGQTNILALNAAIEAARAGEYGRGFAVVADNVRRLAEETKTNAGEISKMTTGIVNDVGEKIIDLQEALQGFGAQSEEFSASSEEVAAAIEEQTAAMHQLTTSAQNLSKVGDQLSILINEYKLGSN
jgi:methyl-accepting chemotaxis protein